MTIYFLPNGRLGNAIFRYFACSLFCIFYNHDFIASDKYVHNSVGDLDFIKWMNGNVNYNGIGDLLFAGFYQHDDIYKKYKDVLLAYMNNHLDHFILGDHITVCDETNKFFIRDLLYEPLGFSKRYDTVIHIRLDDHFRGGVHIAVEHVIRLLDKVCLTENSCIVVQSLTMESEKEYIQTVLDFILSKWGFSICVESNDTLTDYYIMKNARVLVCSMSTLSWAAAFLSSRIEKCYFPDHSMPHGPHCSMKRPIENTELYSIGSE